MCSHTTNTIFQGATFRAKKSDSILSLKLIEKMRNFINVVEVPDQFPKSLTFLVLRGNSSPIFQSYHDIVGMFRDAAVHT